MMLRSLDAQCSSQRNGTILIFVHAENWCYRQSYTGSRPVRGEFVFKRLLAFDINRDSVSAMHNISDRPVWLPQSESESHSPATRERETHCNNFGNPKVSTLDPPPSRTEHGRGILGELFRSIFQRTDARGERRVPF